MSQANIIYQDHWSPHAPAPATPSKGAEAARFIASKEFHQAVKTAFQRGAAEAAAKVLEHSKR